MLLLVGNKLDLEAAVPSIFLPRKLFQAIKQRLSGGEMAT